MPSARERFCCSSELFRPRRESVPQHLALGRDVVVVARAGEHEQGEVGAAGFEAEGCRAVLLGAGGSARAVGAALAARGARLTLANRGRARAEQLAGALRERFGEGAAAVAELGTPVVTEALRGAHLLVNSTPVGMAPRQDEVLLVEEDALRPYTPPVIAKGTPVETEWSGTWYPGCVVETRLGLNRVHHDGHPPEDDEWVPGSRMRPRPDK